MVVSLRHKDKTKKVHSAIGGSRSKHRYGRKPHLLQLDDPVATRRQKKAEEKKKRQAAAHQAPAPESDVAAVPSSTPSATSSTTGVAPTALPASAPAPLAAVSLGEISPAPVNSSISPSDATAAATLAVLPLATSLEPSRRLEPSAEHSFRPLIPAPYPNPLPTLSTGEVAARLAAGAWRPTSRSSGTPGFSVQSVSSSISNAPAPARLPTFQSAPVPMASAVHPPVATTAPFAFSAIMPPVPVTFIGASWDNALVSVRHAEDYFIGRYKWIVAHATTEAMATRYVNDCFRYTTDQVDEDRIRRLLKKALRIATKEAKIDIRAFTDLTTLSGQPMVEENEICQGRIDAAQKHLDIIRHLSALRFPTSPVAAANPLRQGAPWTRVTTAGSLRTVTRPGVSSTISSRTGLRRVSRRSLSTNEEQGDQEQEEQ